MASRRWLPIALGGFAAGVLLAPTVAAAAHPTAHRLKAPAARSATGQIVTSKVSRSQQRATLAYWTPARMRSAKPLDILVRGSAPSSGSSAPAANGAPGSVRPVTPGGKYVNSLTASAASGPSATAFSYPFPFTRFNVFPTSLYKAYPREVNGKVFFTQNGTNFVCSGTSVASANRNEVWLAGHCVAGSGHFDSFAEFVPAYNGNASNVAPKGVFVATNFATTTAWLNSGDFSRDLGAMIVNANSSGALLQNTVGGAGFAFNQSRDEQFVDFGYPQASPFNGNSMVTCLGSTAVADTGVGGSGPAPIGIGCDMTGGSSGGSWQISYGGAGGNLAGFINGHNDYKYSSQPLAMYSPYFDSTANAVRCALEPTGSNGC